MLVRHSPVKLVEPCAFGFLKPVNSFGSDLHHLLLLEGDLTCRNPLSEMSC